MHNYLGKKFGRLIVQTRLGAYHICLCDCGARVPVRTDKLTTGRTQSCGCLRKDLRTQERNVKITRGKRAKKDKALAHAIARQQKYAEVSREERKLRAVWAAMINRCTNPQDKSYKHYGGRGIDVCLRWQNRALFLEDMLPLYVNGRWLERIENDEGYSPNNCEFVTPIKNTTNRGNTLWLWDEKSGVEVSLAIRCRFHNIPYNKAYAWYSRERAQDRAPTLQAFFDALFKFRVSRCRNVETP